MNIALPTSLQAWVDEQATKNRCRTSGQYIGQVLRKERQRQLIAEVERKLIDGLNSGESREWTDADWQRIRQKARRRVAARKGRR